MRLLTRWQNSAGERVRIALHLKAVPFEYVALSSMGPDEYLRLNPQGLLPALDIDGQIIAQSSAILDYLEETYPSPSLLPSDPVRRAQARGFAALIQSEMHALTVLRVRRHLQHDVGASEQKTADWVNHWLSVGFRALEETLERRPEQYRFCFGDEPGWADLHLVPQLSTARRLGCELESYPRLLGVEQLCVSLDAFRRSVPQAQPDFPAEPSE